MSIALAGVSLPCILGIGVSFVLQGSISKGASGAPLLVFMGVAVSITAFPVLARILAERKLLTTDVGQMAMSAAAVNDVAAWILLTLAIALSGTGQSPLIALWVFLCGSSFVTLCSFVLPPIFKWMSRSCPEGRICHRYDWNSHTLLGACGRSSYAKGRPICWCSCRKGGGSCL